MLRLIGKIAYVVGYLVGTIKWYLGIYVRIDDLWKSEKWSAPFHCAIPTNHTNCATTARTGESDIAR